MYIPNSQNTPVFKDKHDVILSGSYSNYQIAYAPTSHLGIMINGYYREGDYLTPDNDKIAGYEGSAKLLEAGIGYYKQNEKTMFSIYGGWGKGHCSISFSPAHVGTVKHESNYNRLFIQPTLSFGNEYIQCITSTRLSFVNLYNFKDGPIIPGLSQNSHPVFLEPSISAQIKLGLVYFHAQLQGSIATSKLSDAYSGYTPYQSLPVVSAGFLIHIKDWLHSEY
jgi:hypothetical protein